MIRTGLVLTASVFLVAICVAGNQSSDAGPYKVVKTVKAGGDGGFEDVYADVQGRRLYVPRSGQNARVSVFDLDTLAPAGELTNGRANDATVDAQAGHGFASSRPVLLMWDTKTMQTIQKIDVQGLPDEIMFDAYKERVYVFSHQPPNATVLSGADGSIVGTIDMGGGPEKAVADGKGTIYAELEDKNSIVVIDANALSVSKRFDLSSKCDGPSGLAFDKKNGILFVACRDSRTMTIVNAADGNILAALPIGVGTDDAAFNPNTMEAFSPQSDGTLTVIKENSPTSFSVEQTLTTMPGARTVALDTKTNQLFLIAAEYGPPPTPDAQAPAAQPPAAAPAPAAASTAPAPAPAAASPAPAEGAPAPAAGTGRGRGRGRGGRGGRGPMMPDSFTILVVGKA
jgi:hypothetical protein